MAEHTFGFRTRALHAGAIPDAQHGARAVPIYQTTSFVFKDSEDAANLFALQKYGNIYSRLSNPTVAALEERVASLEGGIGAVATASGMAAEFITFAALCQQGDHIVASAQLYGGTKSKRYPDPMVKDLANRCTFFAKGCIHCAIFQAAASAG